MPLVTEAQVMTLVGVEVTAQHIAEAEADVDRIAGIDLDDADQVAQLNARDLKLLKWALIYQSAWLSTQIDMHARLDVVEISGATSDGSVKARDELTLQLAPRCRSNLERISWKRKRTVRLPAARGRDTRGPITTSADVTIHTDGVDTYAQLPNALRDAGIWGEDDRGCRR
jgi:hypothetical protein